MTPTRPTPWAWMLPDRSTHLQLPAEPMFTLTARRWGKSPMPTMPLVDETAHIPALPEQFLRPARQDSQLIFGEMGYGKATMGKRIPQWWIDRLVIEKATASLFDPRPVMGPTRLYPDATITANDIRSMLPWALNTHRTPSTAATGVRA